MMAYGFEINVPSVVVFALLWLLVYNAVYRLAALGNPSLVCWSVGPLGVTAVPLREPSLGHRLWQLALAALALAVLAYASLFLLRPPPILGLDQSLSGRALAVLIPVVVFTVWRLVGIVRERRFPLWGEARVMTSVQRGIATGAIIFFTPAGRTFLRERFGATPSEFLQMVRL
jgi:hypothetical protein